MPLSDSDAAPAGGARCRLAISAWTANAWSRLVSGFAGLSLVQSWEYGEAKAESGPWRVERGVFEEGDGVAGAVQALVRRLPLVGGGLAWINRGPLWRRAGGPAAAVGPLLGMVRELKRHYVDGQGLYLRLAPNVAASALADDGLAGSGVRATATLGWASALVDLEPPVEALREALDQKWRNALNKAERSRVDVAGGDGGAPFEEFLAAHERQAREGRFAGTVTADLLRRLQEKLPEDRKMVALIARHEGRTVGAALIARYGATAEYLAGNVSEEGRRLNAGQLLLWRAATGARERGLRAFDVGGMDPELTPKGIYRFKEGLGGRPYRLANEVEAWRGPLGRLVRWRVNRAKR
jgi:hypothetical protein